MNTVTPKTALVLIAEGSEEMEVTIIVDVLRRAGIKVTLCSLDEELVNCSRQVILKATIVLSKLKTPNDFDALVLPGGLQGANAMKDSKKVKEIVQHYYSNNKWLGAICAAPIVLLEAKIAFGKKITSHPTVSKSLEADFDYQQDRVVVDGNLISSQGPGTAIEFALQIVESMMDEAIRKKVQDPLICKA